MSRFAVMNSAKMFVDNSNYRGDCRRNYPRYKIITPATLIDAEKKPEMVKVVNLGFGGCKFVGHTLVNTQASASMQFYLQSDDDDWKSCVPIHGRVIRVHSKDENTFIVNLVFKGALFAEHGIEQLINQNGK